MARFLFLPQAKEIINIDLIVRLSLPASASAGACFAVAIEFAGADERTEYGEIDGQFILSEMGASSGMSAEQLADALRDPKADAESPFDIVERTSPSP